MKHSLGSLRASAISVVTRLHSLLTLFLGGKQGPSRICKTLWTEHKLSFMQNKSNSNTQHILYPSIQLFKDHLLSIYQVSDTVLATCVVYVIVLSSNISQPNKGHWNINRWLYCIGIGSWYKKWQKHKGHFDLFWQWGHKNFKPWVILKDLVLREEIGSMRTDNRCEDKSNLWCTVLFIFNTVHFLLVSFHPLPNLHDYIVTAPYCWSLTVSLR